jgi:hypothetical protein
MLAARMDHQTSLTSSFSSHQDYSHFSSGEIAGLQRYGLCIIGYFALAVIMLSRVYQRGGNRVLGRTCFGPMISYSPPSTTPEPTLDKSNLQVLKASKELHSTMISNCLNAEVVSLFQKRMVHGCLTVSNSTEALDTNQSLFSNSHHIEPSSFRSFDHSPVAMVLPPASINSGTHQQVDK